MKGVIKEIRVAHQLCEISFDSKIGELYMIGLEPLDGISVGLEVNLEFKSADILLLDLNTKCSSRNRFLAMVKEIDLGEIISTITLESNELEFQAFISSKIVDNFKKNDRIWAYINETSIYIRDIL